MRMSFAFLRINGRYLASAISIFFLSSNDRLLRSFFESCVRTAFRLTWLSLSSAESNSPALSLLPSRPYFLFSLSLLSRSASLPHRKSTDTQLLLLGKGSRMHDSILFSDFSGYSGMFFGCF